MKKFFNLLSLLSIFAMIAVSCSKDEGLIEPVSEQANVTFTVNVPTGVQTRTIGDGKTVDKLYYEVYYTGDTPVIDDFVINGTASSNDGEGTIFTVSFPLVKQQEYTILFWAQNKDNGIYDPTNLKAVKADYSNANLKANMENLDAFYAAKTFEVVDENLSQTIFLTRPFGQLNLGTTKQSTSEAANLGLTVAKTKVKVSSLPTVFNVANGTTSEPTAEAVEFALNTIPSNPAEITVEVDGQDITFDYLSFNYILMSNATTNTLIDVEAQLELNDGNSINHKISAVPVQRNYRTNIIGNLLTSKTDFKVIVDNRFDEKFNNVEVTEIHTNADLEEALKQNVESIHVRLTGDAEINGGIFTMGGANTNTIIIDGTPMVKSASDDLYTLTMTGSYNSVLKTENPNAKVIIKNLNLTSARPSGTWDVYDFMFTDCNVELKNVNVLKSLALDNPGKTSVLKNVNITDNHDYYALWIVAGGNVTINGGSITAENGRAIKVDGEYVNEIQPSYLSVAGMTFKSAKKAAVLVKPMYIKDGVEVSKNTATIDWGEGNNIDGVTADPINAVWIDEDFAAYADMVTVNGALKVVEGTAASEVATVSTTEELKTAINDAKDGAKIALKDGTYEGVFYVSGKSLTLQALNKGKAVINGKLAIAASGKTINVNGISFKNEYSGNVAVGHQYLDKTGTYCIGLYCAYVNVRDCEFNLSKKGGIYFYSFNNPEYCVIEDCTFNCNGFHAIDSKVNITVNRCVFNEPYRHSLQVYGNLNIGEKVVFTNNKIINPCNEKTTSTKFFACGVSVSASYPFSNVVFEISGNTMESDKYQHLQYVYDNKSNVDIQSCTITEGVVFVSEEEAIGKVNSDVIELNTREDMVWFANAVNKSGNSFDGKTVKLGADIDLAGIDWTPVGQTGATQFKGTFDGNNKTLSNLNINSVGTDDEGFYSSGLFGWLNGAIVKNLKIEGAKVVGHHNCGVIAGYMETSGCTIESCTINNADLNCYEPDSSDTDPEGDKVGVFVGYAGNAGTIVKNCIATNSSVSAGRHGGQIAGYAKTANIINCSATNVTVSKNGTSSGADVNEALIGKAVN